MSAGSWDATFGGDGWRECREGTVLKLAFSLCLLPLSLQGSTSNILAAFLSVLCGLTKHAFDMASQWHRNPHPSSPEQRGAGDQSL